MNQLDVFWNVKTSLRKCENLYKCYYMNWKEYARFKHDTSQENKKKRTGWSGAFTRPSK